MKKLIFGLVVILSSISELQATLATELQTLAGNAAALGFADAFSFLYPLLDGKGRKFADFTFNQKKADKPALTDAVLNSAKTQVPANADQYAKKFTETAKIAEDIGKGFKGDVPGLGTVTPAQRQSMKQSLTKASNEFNSTP